MTTAGPCPPTVRPLYGWEIEEARRVFGSRLDYSAVRIHECNPWPDRIDKIGRKLKGMPLLEDSHNAITLGNHCIFPIRLLDHLVDYHHPEHYKMGWLIHELTHAWQYQQLGWAYLTEALKAQFRGKAGAYDFGNETGLDQRRHEGFLITTFNLEQQGDIARSYYERLVRGEDTGAWRPYIADLQGGDERPRVA